MKIEYGSTSLMLKEMQLVSKPETIPEAEATADEG